MENWEQRTEESHIDKSGWYDGPWMTEPDRIEWRNEHGQPCLIVRNQSGALCGYVAVSPGHPLHGVQCDQECEALKAQLEQRMNEPLGNAPGLMLMIGALTGSVGARPDCAINVHGGLTYSDACQAGGKICHVPREGEPETVWWFGFDCAHCNDYSRMDSKRFEGTENASFMCEPPNRWNSTTTYRSVNYVRGEVERLAEQLRAIEAAPPSPAQGAL